MSWFAWMAKIGRGLSLKVVFVSLMCLVFAYGQAAIAQDGGVHSEEGGRIESVNAAPLSITINGRVFRVGDTLWLSGREIKVDEKQTVIELRKLVGKHAGYDWYQEPGKIPVVLSISPFRGQ